MKIQQKNLWGPGSVSYWLTALAAAGIIFIGARFMLAPDAGARGFGIPLPQTKEAMAYGVIKGIRDIFSGIIILIFLLMRMPRVAAFAFSAAVIIPVSDFFTIMSIHGLNDMGHLMIHGITAVYMVITCFLLFRIKTKN